MASASQSSQHRCVFVGNIPYDATEEQLKQICEEVGPVVHFRLVVDRETGKPKGYGFCEYTDEETALSARRNLQGYEINGRQLRVDFAENDKNADKSRDQVRGGNAMVSNVDSQRQFGGQAVMGDTSIFQPMGVSTAIAAATSMAKVLGAAQTTNIQNQMGIQSQPLGSDPLTLHLAKMSRVQLNEIMVELKAMATQNKEEARQVLLALPHLTKAIFQAQLMLGMVTPQMLQMPNILQTAALPMRPPLPDTRFQNQPAQVVPGLPPLPPNTQYTMAHDTAGPSPFSVYNQSQNQVLQHGHLPMESGISTLHSVQQQLPSTVVSRTNLPPGPSSSLTQQNMGGANISGLRPQVPTIAAHPSLADQSVQVQLPPDVESALLQQVMSLTPEQISSMPPDQQQQVTQLQQLLRQST